MADVTVEHAERQARARAIIMALAAVVLLVNAALQFGSPGYQGRSWRGASWAITVILWMVILLGGGGWRFKGRLHALLNDELSLRNRSRALSWGFYATIAAGLLVYIASWQSVMSVADAMRIVTGVGLATALLGYAWLE